MKPSIIGCACTLACGLTSLSYASMDPRDRDEDVSATEVSVEVARDTTGMYVYEYNVLASESNTGEILSFSIDIGCNEQVDSRHFDPDSYPSDAGPNRSEDGKHVPVAIDAPWGEAAHFGVGRTNIASWLLVAEPGESRQGLTLISPYPPGSRAYKLTPSVRYREDRWDYSGIAEDDPDVPWIDDWTVVGVTTGPACPGDETPPGDEEPPVFDGTSFSGETEDLNQLMTYSEPLKNQVRVGTGARHVGFTIHYHGDIDPESFVVTPRNGNLRQLFNPQPGTSEEVRVPLKPGKNRVSLQIQSRHVPPGQVEESQGKASGRDGVSVDRDVFNVRVGAGNRKGNGRTNSKSGKNKHDD